MRSSLFVSVHLSLSVPLSLSLSASLPRSLPQRLSGTSSSGAKQRSWPGIAFLFWDIRCTL